MTRTICALVWLVLPPVAAAQGTGWSGDGERVFFEGRLDFLAGRTNAVHKMIGAHTALGTYGRLAALIGGGLRGVDDTWKYSGRVDVVGRFHVDPLLQARRAVYAGGGVSVLLDPGEAPRPRMLLVVGVDGPRSRAGWIVSTELGIGGGVRASVAWRRTPTGAR